MNAFGYLEHQTGLILTPESNSPGGNIYTGAGIATTATAARFLAGAGSSGDNDFTGRKTPIKSDYTIKALRTLRDSNPSLLNKLSHKSQAIRREHTNNVSHNNDNHDHANSVSHNNDNLDKDANDIDDMYIEYWNSIQEMVQLNDHDHSIRGLNLGGLMVRLKTMCPFFDVLKERMISEQNDNGNEDGDGTLEILNLGGTDIPLQNLLQSLVASATTLSTGRNSGTNDDEKEPDYTSPPSSSSLSFKNTGIQKLYLSGCGISCQRNGIQNLISIVKSCPNIEVLDLRYNDLKISKRYTKQEEDDNRNDFDDLESFFRVHIPQSKIEILHLEGNNIDDDIATAIGDALSNPATTLTELYLGSNKIHANGAKAIAGGLKSNCVLNKLYIEGNFIGDDGVEEFCVLLEEGKKMTNRISPVVEEGGGEVKEFDEDISNSGVALEKLWVENNGVGKEMMKRLSQALQSDSVIGGF